MKKILIILILSLTFISCDMENNPIESNSTEYSAYKTQLDKIDTMGDTIVAYKEGNRIYYKDINNQYNRAYIESGTNSIIVAAGVFIPMLIIISVLIIGIIISIFD